MGCPRPFIVRLNNTLEPIYEDDMFPVDPDAAQKNQMVVFDNANNPGLTPHGFGCVIPDQFALLSKLQKLDLTGTPFVGTIPSVIGVLGQLRRLALPDQFSMIGDIPSEVGLLHRLASLDVTRTYRLDTRRQIPTASYNLTSLEELRAASIAFDGTIPTEIGLLSNTLHALDFSNSSRHGVIPPQIGNLSVLTELHVGGTALSGTVPSELGLLGDRLRHLDLHGSRALATESGPNSTTTLPAVPLVALGGSVPAELASLRRLTHLDLSFTDLSGEWPSELNRQQLSSLRVLNLESTKLIGSITELACHRSSKGDLVLAIEEVSIGQTLLECACCPTDAAAEDSDSS